MSKTFLSILLLFSLLVHGCQYSQNIELPPVPDFGVASNRLNKDLELFLRKSYNTFKIGDTIVLDIHLKSDIQVRPNPNFDARMYLLNRQSNQWEEVPDFSKNDAGGIFFDTSDFVLNANNPNAAISVHPILDKKEEAITLLIAIKGKVLDANNHEIGWTGSYIVVTLKP
jgi:hypothetical protein